MRTSSNHPKGKKALREFYPLRYDVPVLIVIAFGVLGKWSMLTTMHVEQLARKAKPA